METRLNGSFTPKSDQYQISPSASPEITVWITWGFIAYSDKRWFVLPILTTSLIHFSLKGCKNVLFSPTLVKHSGWFSLPRAISQSCTDTSPLSPAHSSQSLLLLKSSLPDSSVKRPRKPRARRRDVRWSRTISRTSYSGDLSKVLIRALGETEDIRESKDPGWRDVISGGRSSRDPGWPLDASIRGGHDVPHQSPASNPKHIFAIVSLTNTSPTSGVGETDGAAHSWASFTASLAKNSRLGRTWHELSSATSHGSIPGRDWKFGLI